MPSSSREDGESASLRTEAEARVAAELAVAFERSSDPVGTRLENFPKYVRRQNLTRFIALYELFKLVRHVKGSVVECGVNRGFGLMSWAKLSAILEPTNLTRRIYGFDTFAGFPEPHQKDVRGNDGREGAKRGELAADSYDELKALVALHDDDRFLGHISKIHLTRGDAVHTIPEFVKENPHLVVSLLFLDFDLYEPTRAALDAFLPRMPKGAVIAFDELDNPLWPGETMALLEGLGIERLGLERFDFDPYIAFARIT
jgi:Macrocin-O-methyltransferase (TylF)